MSGTFRYHFLPADISIDAVAERFRTTKSAVFDATVAEASRTAQASGQTFSLGAGDDASSWSPPLNSFVFVPLPADNLSAPDQVEWREVPSAGRAATFRAVFDDLANGSKLGIGNTPIERETVYFDWRNCDYREAASLRSKGGTTSDRPLVDTVAVYADVGCENADLLPEDKIYVPLTRLIAVAFPVAPSDGKSDPLPATCDLTPTDLSDLHDRLHAIDLACWNLAGIRRRAQQIQADCSKELRRLLMLRALVSVLIDRFNSASTFSGGAREEEDRGRTELLRALDDLIKKASVCMLDAPQKVVDPTLGARWTQVIGYLVSLLKDAKTLALVDKLLPTHGDLPFKRSPSDARTLVDAVCETVAHATFWIADGPSQDDCKKMLDASLTAMQAGKPPTASAAKSLLEYVASLPFVADHHPASTRTSPIAACGVFVAVHAGGELADASAEGKESASAVALKERVTKVVNRLILKKTLSVVGVTSAPDLRFYVELTGRLFGVGDTVRELSDKEKEVKEKSQLAHDLLESRTTGRVEEALELGAKGEDEKAWEQAARAMKVGGREEVREIYAKLEKFEDPQREFRSLSGKIGRVGKILKLVGSIADVPVVPDPKDWEDATKDAQSALDGAREAFETLKKLGILTETSEAITTAVLGRVSFFLGVVLEGDAAAKAFEGSDYLSTASHALQSVGQIMLILAPETGGVTLVVGLVLVSAGVVLDLPKTLKELVTPNSEELFTEHMKHFKTGIASHFANLEKPVDDILAEVSGGRLELPPLNAYDLVGYGGDLYRAGFDRDDF